jgi:hypothetical protein
MVAILCSVVSCELDGGHCDVLLFRCELDSGHLDALLSVVN